ncbi:CGNR zinc finger domain-containing protein [Actinophytocola sp. KF-1]
MAYRHLALELASTIRHDGHGGVTDDLTGVDGLAAWLAANADLLGADTAPADEQLRAELADLRWAVRSLFARAVAPGAAGKMDAPRLPSPDDALARLNAAAVPHTTRLTWPTGGDPRLVRETPGTAPARLLAAVARAAMEFLAGPERERLRACPAPRCVRYFVKEHARQEWCKPSCGNRARVSRYYQRHHT